MKIDNINISKYKAIQGSLRMNKSDMTNESEWPNGWLLPFLGKSQPGFKSFEVDILFKGEGYTEVEKNISDLSALLLEPRLLTFDRRPFLCRAIMEDSDREALDDFGNAIVVTYHFKGYITEKQKAVQINKILETTFKNKGNLKSPAVVEITPSTTETVLSIEGLGDSPITIRNLKAGKKIILNGETGLVTEEGSSNKLPDVDFWEVPRVLPGENTIKLSKKTVDMTILYYPRFF